MKTDAILRLGPDDFTRKVLEADRPVLVDFWADWCQPCHMLAPTIEQLAESYGDRVTIAKVDIDAARELAETYDIKSIPTVLVFKAGEVAGRIVGVRPRPDYAAALDAVLG